MLVGRGPELAALHEAIERTAHGRAAFVIVEGDAGVGKSALLDAGVERAVTAGARIVQAFCDPVGGGRPFGPLLDALGGAGPSAASLVARVRAGVPSGSNRASPLDTGVDAGSLLLEELVAAFEELAIGGHTALFVDDLHWADAPTVQTLVALARRLVDLPLLIVGGMRSGTAGADLRTSLHRQLGRTVGLDVIELHALTGDAGRELVTMHLDGRPGARLAALLDRCAGNPLLVTELIAALDDAGCLAWRGETVDLTPETDASRLPATFADVVRTRMAHMDDRQREVAILAALLGTRFTASDLAAVSGRSPADLAAVTIDLVRARVIVDVGGALVFRHDLVREAIRDLVPEAVAAGLHVHIAESLHAAGAPLPQVAGHLARGARPGSMQAVELLHMAAAEILPLDPAAAVSLLRRALALCPPGEPRRDDLTALLVDGLAWSGRTAEAHEVAEEALVRTLRPDVEERLRSAMARSLLLLGRPQEAVAHAAALLELLDAAGRPTAWGRAELATCRLFGLDVDGALADADLALRGARSEGDTMAEILALSVEQFARNALGETGLAIELGMRAIQLADESESSVGHRLHPSLFHGIALLTGGDQAAARRAFRRGRRLGQELGATWALPIYHFMSALAHWDAGEWDEMLAEVDAGLSFEGEHSSAIGQVWALAIAARVHVHRGDLDRAAAALDAGDLLLQRLGAQFGADWLLLARALWLEAQGRSPEALVLLELLWSTVAELQASASLLLVGPDLVRLAVRSGAVELAERVIGVLSAVAADAGPDPTVQGRERRARGLFGRDPELLLDGAALLTESGRVIEAALARWEAGDLLAAAGDTLAARAVLEEALAATELMSAHAESERIRSRLARLSATRRGRPPGRRPTHGWEALTATEWLVVREVAAGRSNGAVAELLGVSRRTVEAHLRSIYTKLGVSTRVQLAVVHAAHEAR